MAVTLMCEVQWLAHASVARAAEAFYGSQIGAGALINIDSLALLYMLVYLALSLPASRWIDRRGLRSGVGLGALLTAAGALVKAVGGASFAMQLAGQLILACAQPFLINATTALTARWFPLGERGLATGLGSLAQYLGFIVALAVTPRLVQVDPTAAGYGDGMGAALWVYGIASIAAAAAALLWVRDVPLWRPEAAAAAPRWRDLFADKDLRRTLLLFMIGLGVMNALTSLTDAVAGSIGAKDSDGLIGVAMIAGGVLGALVLPILSDRFRRRKPFLVLCAALMLPSLAGLALVKQLNPYAYAWTTLAAPDGAQLALKRDIPHPTLRAPAAGRYEFALVLSRRSDGAVVENRTLAVDIAAPGQTQLLDGTPTDDGVIAAIYAAALAAAFVFGFAVMSAGPLGFQYAAEVAYPAPEAAAQGALLLVGQVSGIAFTAAMSIDANRYLDATLWLFTGLAVVMLVLALRLGESPLILGVDPPAEKR
jgi:MFS family permease